MSDGNGTTYRSELLRSHFEGKIEPKEFINIRALHVSRLTAITPEEKARAEALTKSDYFHSIEEAEATIDSWRQYPDYEVYYGVCTRNTEQPKAEHIARAFSLWGDQDGNGSDKKGELTTPKEDLLKSLDTFVLPPGPVTDSGHGYHPYWMIEPTNDLEAVQAANKKLQKFLLNGGAVSDPTRIMRIDGTFNRKGGGLAPVTLVRKGPAYLYHVGDVAAAASLCPEVVEKIHSGKATGYKSRSERDYAIISALIIAGMTDDGIEIVFAANPNIHDRGSDIRKECERIREALKGDNPRLSRLAKLQLEHQGGDNPAGVTLLSEAESYVAELRRMGKFRLNKLNSAVEMDGRPMTDVLLSQIRHEMRVRGFDKQRVFDDALVVLAAEDTYHPVAEYLNGLQWDGQSHIDLLSSYFTNPDEMFPTYLKRWLVNSIARVLRGEQVPMNVLVGPQNIGKSYFSRWLASGIAKCYPFYGVETEEGGVRSRFYKEDAINPESKDDQIALATVWLWEVGELGHTTRRADVDALKFYLSKDSVNVRLPYGRYPVVAPAITSFIGTVNDDGGGFLNDPTGTRRFLVCEITHIDFAYSQKIDIDQVWAEAVHLYRDGFDYKLSEEETRKRDEINAQYTVRNALEDIIKQYFDWTTDPNDHRYDEWLPVRDIEEELELQGVKIGSGNALGRALTSLGLPKAEPKHAPRHGKTMQCRRGIWSRKAGIYPPKGAQEAAEAFRTDKVASM